MIYRIFWNGLGIECESIDDLVDELQRLAELAVKECVEMDISIEIRES